MATTDSFLDTESRENSVLAPDVLHAARGDRRAFERLYETHVRRVYGLCLRMAGNQERADELTQDIFIRVWDKLPQFRGESAFSTWLYRLAVNVVLESRRSARRNDARHTDATLDSTPEPLVNGASVEGRLDLAKAMATLPPGARAVFALHDIEGYKHEEIAVLLKITPGGSRAQLHRARQLLRTALS